MLSASNMNLFGGAALHHSLFFSSACILFIFSTMLFPLLETSIVLSEPQSLSFSTFPVLNSTVLVMLCFHYVLHCLLVRCFPFDNNGSKLQCFVWCDWYLLADMHASLICRFCARYAPRGDVANPTATWSSLSARPYMLVAMRKVSSNDLVHFPISHI